MPFNVLLFFFLKRDFYVTHIHTYTHTHNAPMFEQKKKKRRFFSRFFVFRIIKKKKNIDPSTDRPWKKKYSLERNVSLNRRRGEILNLLIVIFSGKDYDPFLLAEQQMNDLLSDTSEQSVADSCPSIEQNSRQKSFPLSHSSAFAKYPCPSSSNPSRNVEKRSSSIPPPTELDDITSDFSSDSTETNSLSRELLFSLKDEKERTKDSRGTNPEKRSPVRELGRRVIIDKSKALGGDELVEEGNKSVVVEARKIVEPRPSVKMIRPIVDRSLSVRASSAPKAGQERGKNPKIHSHDENVLQSRKNKNSNGRNNNYPLNLSSSNLSLSSIISSDVDMKRSNSVFDELMTSFEEDENGSFVPSLKSLLKTDSLSSPVHASRHRNGRISDEELSSPESYKRQDHNKMSGDSAYSR